MLLRLQSLHMANHPSMRNAFAMVCWQTSLCGCRDCATDYTGWQPYSIRGAYIVLACQAALSPPHRLPCQLASGVEFTCHYFHKGSRIIATQQHGRGRRACGGRPGSGCGPDTQAGGSRHHPARKVPRPVFLAQRQGASSTRRPRSRFVSQPVRTGRGRSLSAATYIVAVHSVPHIEWCLMFAALKDESALFRHDVAFCLGQRQDPAAIQTLKGLLHDANEHPM